MLWYRTVNYGVTKMNEIQCCVKELIDPMLCYRTVNYGVTKSQRPPCLPAGSKVTRTTTSANGTERDCSGRFFMQAGVSSRLLYVQTVSSLENYFIQEGSSVRKVLYVSMCFIQVLK